MKETTSCNQGCSKIEFIFSVFGPVFLCEKKYKRDSLRDENKLSYVPIVMKNIDSSYF